MRTLVVGMGNPILCDDAVGVRLARDFGALPPTADVSVLEECSVGGLNLLETLAGWDRLIVLDAIQTRDAVPGNWFYFTAAELRQTMHLSNIHDVNFSTALELGRRMGTKLPPDEEIHIFAVEVRDPFTFGERMTEELEGVYPRLSREILEEMRAISGRAGLQPLREAASG